jgi:phosphopantothenoylcysteine decarboxylase/phosphopantothenate--cysteine ligase
MGRAVNDAVHAGTDWLFMAAAVADFTPVQFQNDKLKKESMGDSWSLEMTRTADILAELVPPGRRGDLRLVGFALETADLVSRAARKREKKGLDFIVANDPTEPDAGFGDTAHRVYLIGPEGVIWDSGSLPKSEIARGLFAQLADHAAVPASRTGPDRATTPEPASPEPGQ